VAGAVWSGGRRSTWWRAATSRWGGWGWNTSISSIRTGRTRHPAVLETLGAAGSAWCAAGALRRRLQLQRRPHFADSGGASAKARLGGRSRYTSRITHAQPRIDGTCCRRRARRDGRDRVLPAGIRAAEATNTWGRPLPAESRAAQKWGKEWLEKNLSAERQGKGFAGGSTTSLKSRGQTLAQCAGVDPAAAGHHQCPHRRASSVKQIGEKWPPCRT